MFDIFNKGKSLTVHDVGQLIVRFPERWSPLSAVEARIGVLAVLHTWSQNQGPHPYLHCRDLRQTVAPGWILEDSKA